MDDTSISKKTIKKKRITITKIVKKSKLNRKKELEAMSVNSLTELTRNHLRRIETSADANLIKGYERDLKLILEIVDSKLALGTISNKGHRNNSLFMYYPDYKDPDFNKKIYSKKEFYINRIPRLTGKIDLDSAMKERCSGFRLSHNQKFLKIYLSDDTPYNSLLLFHGTGVGKTCSSVSIAEQFVDILERYNKKVYILLNPSIEANFRKNIFNINKVKEGKELAQCTRDTYLQKVKKYKNYDDLEKKVARKINNNYSFLGYQKFSNRYNMFITKLENMRFTKEQINKKIKDYYSNSVIIVDEVHNIKESGSMMKDIPNQLARIVSNADNVKLILLSATPMFNQAEEIVFLLNLLLMNNKQPIIETTDIFDKKGKLTPNGEKILAYKSRGIVSYLRGENPLMFPKRLYPLNNKHLLKPSEFPNKTRDNEPINADDMIKNLKILNCPMTGYQKKLYSDFEIEKKSKDQADAFEMNGILLSNITYPPKNVKTVGSAEDAKDVKYMDVISNGGFDNVFNKSKEGGRLSYTSDNLDFLDTSNIGKYSSKFKMILDNIKNSEGVIFIYSRFVSTGVLSLALALEYNGYSKFGSGNLLKGGALKPKNGLSYIIISGNTELSYKSYEKYLAIENENKNGDKVKIILGSESAAEGLDFRFIREVHIIEPWYHLNKIEQVIGRAIRFCSHIELDFPLRNTTIFMYAASKSDNPSNDTETVDFKVYRDAENKDSVMADIAYILKRNALDCNINLYGNKFTSDSYNQKVEMINSKKEKILVSIGDAENERTRICQYRKCDFTCAAKVKENLTEEELNNDTFNIRNVKDNINEIIDTLKTLFKRDTIYTLSNIVSNDKIVKLHYNKQMIYYALEELLAKREQFSDMFGNKGILVYKGGHYMFEPDFMKGSKLLSDNIRFPVPIKTKKLDITKTIVREELKVDISELLELLRASMDNRVELFKKIHYLLPKKKEKLLQVIFLKLIDATLKADKLLSKCYDLLESLFITKKDYQNLDIEEDYFGYFYADNNSSGKLMMNYMKYDYSKKEFIKVPQYESDIISKRLSIREKYYINKKTKEDSKTKKDTTVKKVKNTNIIIGYLEKHIRDNTVSLKLRNFSKITNISKLTRVSYGSVCIHEKEIKIMKFITELGIHLTEEEILSMGKGAKCSLIEDTLINRELDPKSLIKYYYTLEDTCLFTPNSKSLIYD